MRYVKRARIGRRGYAECVASGQGLAENARIVITREQIEDLFVRARALREEGDADWDVDGTCLWSYYFVDDSRDRLADVCERLESEGYTPVGLLEPSPEDEDQETLFLRVDRIERHTVETLVARNDELHALAELFELAAYDGMDCGPVE